MYRLHVRKLIRNFSLILFRSADYSISDGQKLLSGLRQCDFTHYRKNRVSLVTVFVIVDLSDKRPQDY